MHEKSAQLALKKMEAEAAARKAALDARAADRRSAVEARMAAHREKIRLAAEERRRREEAYQALLRGIKECVCFPLNAWRRLASLPPKSGGIGRYKARS
jgi:hypothetical protein